MSDDKQNQATPALAVAPCSALPIPEALYSCRRCAEDYSWPASDLQWSKPAQSWVCWQCWDHDSDGCMIGSTTLKAEIARQNTRTDAPTGRVE